MPRTSEKCMQSGIYQGDCGCKQIALSKGDTFPPCHSCHKAVNYRLVQATK
jgi:hypothetical protein